MTPEQLKRFDEASSHPYECKCDLCKEWWASVPPEDDEEECGLCGGSGVYDGECGCGDDTCCCLTPTPVICPQCGSR